MDDDEGDGDGDARHVSTTTWAPQMTVTMTNGGGNLTLHHQATVSKCIAHINHANYVHTA